jgi:hypothetical protein
VERCRLAEVNPVEYLREVLPPSWLFSPSGGIPYRKQEMVDIIAQELFRKWFAPTPGAALPPAPPAMVVLFRDSLLALPATGGGWEDAEGAEAERESGARW